MEQTVWTMGTALAGLLAGGYWAVIRRRATEHYAERVAAQAAKPIPQPPRGLLGHLPYALKGDNGCAYSALVKLHKSLGDVFQLTVLGDEWICVADLDSVYKILVTDRDTFPKAGAAVDEMKSVFGDTGILVSEGADWLRQRRMCMPAFRHEQMKAMVEGMNAVTTRTLQFVHQNEEVNALDLFNRAAFANICQVGFDHGVDAFTEGAHDPLMDAQEMAALELVKRVQRTRYWKKLPLPSNFRLARLLAEQQRLMQEIIREKSEHASDAKILLNEFMRARDDNGEGLSDVDLLHMCQQLMAAGHETTGAAMHWTLYFLVTNPQWLARVRAEADAVMGERELLEFDDVKRLRCFEQVFNEVMRIRPPFPLLVRSVAEDTHLNGYFYPKGAAVLLMLGEVHVDPRFWGEHPERFDPDNFAPGKENGRPLHAYMPFGIGPRLCVGNKFTMMEAAMVVVPLLRAFDFELVPEQNVQPFLRTSWSTRNGIRFKVKSPIQG